MIETNSARMWVGIPTRGRSEASAPAWRAAVSGRSAVTTPAATVPASSTTYTRWVGAGANSTSAPAPTEPPARPSRVATLVTTPARPRACGGAKSTTAAESVVIAAPVAMPCTTRAARSVPTPSATRKSTSATTSSATAAASTGRRPT